jgi:hypothetical protein
MAELTVQEVTLAGLTETLVSAAVGGDTFKNDGRTFFYVKNAAASPITVTFTTPGKVSGVDISDPAVTVTNATQKLIGPFNPSVFNTAAGLVGVAYSSATTITVCPVRLP